MLRKPCKRIHNWQTASFDLVQTRSGVRTGSKHSPAKTFPFTTKETSCIWRAKESDFFDRLS
jgi:hypothetical protein